MPFCASCRWEYRGSPRYCRECGRPLFRSALAARPGHGAPDGGLGAEPEPDWPSAARVAAVAGAPLLAAGLLGGAVFLAPGLAAAPAALSGLPLDEAWARLVYARSLASEARLAFNPGPPEAAVSSLLWVGLMALLIKTLGALGLSVVALAKGVSLLAGAASVALSGHLARRLAGRALFGLAVGLLVALDPGFGYASASGIETTLFAALALGALLAFLEGRQPLTGGLLALATLTRVEGLLLAGLIGLAALAPLLASWRPRGTVPRRPAPGDLLIAAALVGPAVAAFWLWGALDGTAQDGYWPRPVYLALTTLAPPSPAALAGLWRGYVTPSVWALSGFGALVALPLLALGTWWLARQWSRIILPIALFPVLAVLGAAAIVEAPAPWGFEQRRLLDATRPFLALLLALGVLALWRLGRAWSAPSPSATPTLRGNQVRRRLAATATVLAVAVPMGGLPALWARLPLEYGRAAAGLNGTYFALALQARQELPPETLIVALEPGTLRYVSRQPVADARGLHTRGLAGLPTLEALGEARAGYAALPRRPLYESWPPATLVQEFAPGPVLGPSPGSPLGLYRVAAGGAVSPRDGLFAFPLEPLRRLDYLDVGSEAAERAHAYQIEGARGTTRVALRVTPQHAVEDDGRAFIGAESFEIASEPGRDLIVARRFEAGGATMVVRIDGQVAGEWRPRPLAYALAEDTFRVPSGLVRRPRVQVRLELVPGSAPRGLSFGYWSFVDR
ncbi:MAG TPA: hypothetical protein VGM69_25220 [Chloroflexota bacterium]